MKEVQVKEKSKNLIKSNLSAFQEISSDKYGYNHEDKKNQNKLLWHLSSFKPLKERIEITRENTYDIAYKTAVFSKKDIELLNPDKIDNRLFWSELDKNFKYSPICGIVSNNENEVNEINLKMFQPIIERYADIFKNSNIMEIGYGLGSFPYYCEKYSNLNIDNYYGIDYLNRIKQREYPTKYNFYETDGLIIPMSIPNDLDIVFSSNVFQHLSLKEKINYFKLSYDKLKDGGHFIFNCVLKNEFLLVNYPRLWGFKDYKGIPYLKMFDQFIEVDDSEVLKSEILKIGYKIIEFENIIGNHFEIVLMK